MQTPIYTFENLRSVFHLATAPEILSSLSLSRINYICLPLLSYYAYLSGLPLLSICSSKYLT